MIGVVDVVLHRRHLFLICTMVLHRGSGLDAII